MAKNKDTILITYEGGNSELFWKKSAGLTNNRVDVLVPETHYAVAIKDGKYLDTLSGGKFTVNQKSRKDKTSVDIVFMSKTHKLRILWGTKSRIDFTSPSGDEDFSLGASGEYEVQISSPKHFYLELVGTDDVFDAEKLKERLQTKILAVIENEIRNAISIRKWEANQLQAQKHTLSMAVQVALARMLELDYGLGLASFFISNIVATYDKPQKPAKQAQSQKSFCISCGVEIEKTHNYCFNCGQKTLNQRQTQTSGGIQINYCTNCGKAVDAEDL